MSNTTTHRRLNNRTTILRADEAQEGMPVSMVTAHTMSFDPGIGGERISGIFVGNNGFRVLYFGQACVTVPDDAEVWVSDPEGRYV